MLTKWTDKKETKETTQYTQRKNSPFHITGKTISSLVWLFYLFLIREKEERIWWQNELGHFTEK